MRINMPVNNIERHMNENDYLVSKTNAKGVIIYVNQPFIDISGYSKQELIGQAHNLVRHPDMPPGAFEDLWKTIQQGKPWSGLIKNRAKDGSFYWVYANVAPIYESGQITGYMSVRSKPTREQILEAEALYREMREGRCRFKIEAGELIPANWLGYVKQKIRSFTIQSRINVISLLAIISIIVMGGWSLWSDHQSKEQLRAVYEDRTLALLNLSTILDAINHMRINALIAFNSNNREIAAQRAADTAQLDQAFEENWARYTNTGFTPEEKVMADRFYQDFDAYRHSRQKTMSLSVAGNFEEARAHAAKDAGPKYNQAHLTLVDLFDIQDKQTRKAYELSNERFELIKKATVGIIVFFCFFYLFLTRLLHRAINKPLAIVGAIFKKMALGDYTSQVRAINHDEIGCLIESVRVMQTRAGAEIDEIKRVASENYRIRNTLDQSNSSIMIIDDKHCVIFINQAMRSLLSKHEKQLAKMFDSKPVNQVIGQALSVFVQQFDLDNLKKPSRELAKLEGSVFQLTFVPVFDESGVRLGTSIEWLDRTAELSVEAEIAQIVKSASEGDFTKRLEIQNKTGFFEQLAKNINQLLENNERGLSDIGKMLEAMAKGDLTQTITSEYKGMFEKLRTDANATVQQLTEIIRQIKESADSINITSHEIAQGNTDLSQRTEQQSISLDNTSASMEELTATVKQNAENAKQANQLAASASDVATQGGEVVGQVVETMSSINESSKRIVDIISVIDGIAFQTNILALNAAVEAARAGEQGRGFAVVATEVRTLAQRSAAAAREIKSLIGDSVSKVENGTQLVDQAGRTMNEIVMSVRRVTDIMAEISAASQEQSEGIEKVNMTIAQMDEITQQNSALVEEGAAASESMYELASELAKLVAVFRTNSSDSFVAKNSSEQVERRGPNRATNVKRLPLSVKLATHSIEDTAAVT